MMPLLKLRMRPLTINVVPHSTVAARSLLVRPSRRDSHNDPSNVTSAAGINHEIWVPICELKSRVMPVGPHMLPPPVPPPPTPPPPPVTLPVSLPVRRPKPL